MSSAGFTASRSGRCGTCFLLDEDLRHRPDATLHDLCRFLGAAPPARPIRTEVEYFRGDPALARPDRDDIACLNALCRDDITDTAARIGRNLSHWLETA